jgi:hypothetical protein
VELVCMKSLSVNDQSLKGRDPTEVDQRS